MTALPIVETLAGDVSAYIPTNVISITDGQIYLESELFYAGIRPAINSGLSVSRVGGAAQFKAMKQVAGRLRLELTQYRELEAFARFGQELDKETRQRLTRGERIVEILKQTQFEPMSFSTQVISLFAITYGLLDDIKIENVRRFERELHRYINSAHEDLLREIEEKKALDDELEDRMQVAITEFKQRFISN